MQQVYICIDLKSFFASVECVERGLDPLTTNLVVADAARTEKTICLAVSPSLKAYGIPGRPRLFEVVQQVATVNVQRRQQAPGRQLTGKSFLAEELWKNPTLAVDYIVAPPQMAKYLAYSSRVYSVYLRHVAPEDIHVYSIDEVFIDATDYLTTLRCTARQFAMRIILEVLQETGITATAGIGSNLYLSKVAMDIVAKHIPPDRNGVRIAMLNEDSYRRLLWDHRPLTDFWRVGKGYAKKLEENGMFTMGDVARRSVTNEDLLYKLFGKNAELLIDHAWGWEPCTVEAVKAYKPESNSLGSGQVLHQPYEADKARLVLREMADLLSMDLVDKGFVTDQLVVTIGYDIENLTDPERRRKYCGEVVKDHYGRQIPKHAHGTINLERYTSSTKQIMDAAGELFDRITDKSLLIRRLNITATHVIDEASAPSAKGDFEQLDLFTDYAALDAKRKQEDEELAREKKVQQAMLTIKKKFGKNAILKGMNLSEGATAKDRNAQIGGHKA